MKLSIRYEIEHLCSLFGVKLNPSRGQHFLLSRKILSKEVRVAELNDNDIVLDIGAGFGFLTEEIAKYAKMVYAIEIDPLIARVFEWRLSSEIDKGKIKLIVADALQIPFPEEITAIISNPPYHVISPLIIKILRECFSKENFRIAVMILQQEYIKRLFAKPGSKHWGRISAAFRYFAKGKIIQKIPRKYFFPRPEVDSVLIKIWPISSEHLIDFGTFEKVTNILFIAPNKKVRRVLRDYLKVNTSNWRSLLSYIEKNINLEKRIRQLTVEEIEKIAFYLRERNIV